MRYDHRYYYGSLQDSRFENSVCLTVVFMKTLVFKLFYTCPITAVLLYGIHGWMPRCPGDRYG